MGVDEAISTRESKPAKALEWRIKLVPELSVPFQRLSGVEGFGGDAPGKWAEIFVEASAREANGPHTLPLESEPAARLSNAHSPAHPYIGLTPLEFPQGVFVREKSGCVFCDRGPAQEVQPNHTVDHGDLALAGNDRDRCPLARDIEETGELTSSLAGSGHNSLNG